MRLKQSMTGSLRWGWGVPTLVFDDDHALFGPVLIDPPAGPAAVRLWDLVVGWSYFPNLYEVQHPKRREDLRAIEAAISSLSRGADWVSMQKETP